MAGLIASALAGGLQGAGAAAERGLARMQESEERMSFEQERAKLEEARQQRLLELQNAQRDKERQQDQEIRARERSEDQTIRKTERGEDQSIRARERDEDRTVRAGERADDRTERQKDREFQEAQRKLDREAQERNTRLHVGATMAAAKLQAERANTTYQTGSDGNLYRVSPKGSEMVTNSDGTAFKPAKDVSQSALKLADIYQSQAKALADAAKNDPIGGKDMMAESRRYSEMAAGIISGKMPEPKFSVPDERANKFLSDQIRQGRGAEAIRDYELKFGPGSASKVPGVAESGKTPAPAAAAPPAAGIISGNNPEIAPKRPVDNVTGREESFTGNEDRSYTMASRALVQREQSLAKQIASATGEEQAKLLTELQTVQAERKKLNDQARSKSIVIRD